MERLYRFPKEFLEDNCSPKMLLINDMDLDMAYDKKTPKEARIAYFKEFAERINADNRCFNRLKNRLEDSIKLAIKRVEWNYKTAIPMYNPRQKKGSLLLPLVLLDESHVDLAMVVQRHASGAYQEETILSLDYAYSNSRLITRPDSDWLKVESIVKDSHEAVDDYEDDEEEDY